MAISTYASNALLSHLFHVTAFAEPSIYASLHTGDPGTTGASELTGGSYARVAANGDFAAASGQSISSNAAITWTNLPASTVGWVGFWDAASGGNFLFGMTMSASKTTSSGDTLQANSGNLTATMS